MARAVPPLLFFISLVLSCTRPGATIPEPSYNPHLLKAGKYIPANGRAVFMDSVAPTPFTPVRSEYIRARPSERVSRKITALTLKQPQYFPAAPRVIDKHKVAKPNYKPVRGIKRLAPWPEWKPTSLAYKENGRFPFFYLDMEQGLNESWIQCLMESRDGRVWIGTWESGLSVWDGAGLMQFTTENGLSSNETGAILEDREGRIWIGTPNSIDVWDGDGFTRFQSEGLNVSRVGKMLEDRRGHIWIGTWKGGLRVWDGAGFTYFSTAEGLASNRVQSLVEDKDGRVWIATTGGVSIWDGKGFLQFTTGEGLPDNDVLCLLEDRAGKIWMGTAKGLCVWDGAGFTYYTTEEGLSNNYIWYLAEAPDGKVWIGTFNGLTVWDGRRFDSYNQEDGLSHNIMLRLLVDRYGKIWAGTQGGGVNVWEDNGFEHYSEATNGLIYNDIHSLLESRDGKTWIGTQGGELLEWRKDGFTRHFTPNNIRYNFIQSLLEDKEERIWIGTSVHGLLQWDGEQFYHLALSKDQNYDVVTSLLEDRVGNLWIGTIEGVIVKSKAGFKKYSTRQRLSDNSVISLLEDKDGKVWIGTGNGLSVWEEGQLANYLEADGFGSRYVVNCLLEALDGKIWIGTSRGLGVWDGAGFTFYNTKEGLSHNVVLSLSQDQAGNIWAGTKNGLNRLTELKNEREIAIRVYDDNDGLRGQVIKNMLAGHENRLWLSGNKGFDQIGLDAQPPDTSRPILMLREMHPFFDRVDWRQVKKAGDGGDNPVAGKQNSSLADVSFDSVLAFTNLPFRPVFPHNINQLNFHWSATHRAAHKLQYSYFMEGNDPAWSPLIKGNERSFQNLRPGHYTFKLRAVAENGQWSETQSYTFTILPPWWATNTAYLGYALATLLLLYVFYRFQLNRRMAEVEARRLRELDAFKTNLYTNLTHEFRTPLTVILGMAGQIRGQEQIRQLIRRNGQALLGLINQMLDLRKLEVGTLQLEMVQNNIILFLQYLCESFHSSAAAKGIQLSFQTDTENLIMDYDPEHLRQVVSNLLSNAIKFTPGPGRVQLTVRSGAFPIDNGRHRLTAHSLRLTVSDTGIGVPGHELPKIFSRFYQADTTATRKAGGAGIGLALVKELVEAMGGTISVESEGGTGSVFTVILPISQKAPLGEMPATPEAVSTQALTASTASDNLHSDSAFTAKIVSTKSPLALIVEDNSDVAHYLKMCLQADYRVEWAANGISGLEKAMEMIPDIIISDVMMPEMDGFELCRFLKAEERTSHIPIILLTARATQEDRLKGLERGADAYLAKPFDRLELEVRLRKLMELRWQLRDKYRHAGLIEEGGDRADDPELNFLRKLQKAILDNLDNEAFKVEPHLCRAMAMSRPQLYRKLKALKDVSPSELIREIRLQQGRRLILQTKLNISDVAESVGFKDPSYFTRSYSAAFGESPSETRERAK